MSPVPGRDQQGEPEKPMVVIKVGGGKDLNVPAIADDLTELTSRQEKALLVHGGAEYTNEVAAALGHPPQFVTSESGITSRRTDRRTLEVFCMVYCGQLNKMWVEMLQARGVSAVGLSGMDGRILQGRRKDKIRVRRNGRRMVIRDDWTGAVDTVNPLLLDLLLDNGFFPVVTPPALSHNGEAINVDGDAAAALLAIHYKASTLLYLSNVPGLLAHFPDENSLIDHIPAAKVNDYVAVAEGRMKRKVMGAGHALQNGVKTVIFADGRAKSPVRNALAGGSGTYIGEAEVRS